MNREFLLKKGIIFVVIVVFLGAVVFFFGSEIFSFHNSRVEKEDGKTESFAQKQVKNAAESREYVSKKLAALDDELASQKNQKKPVNENDLKSENYKIKQINIDGGVVFVSSAAEHTPLEIFEVRSESIVSKKDDSFKLIISWKTNHPAMSELHISSSTLQNAEIIKEDNYNVDHSVILSNLMPSTRYVYQVKATDKWGKEAFSKKFGTVTNSGDAKSVFQIIAEEFNKIFGWIIDM